MSESKAGVVKLNDVRLAFTQALFEPKVAPQGGNAKYNVGIILTPDHPGVTAMKAAMTEVAKSKWGSKAAEVYNQLSASDRLALHDGDSKPNVQGYPGNHYINASSDSRPLVLDRNRSPLSAADGKPYSGCFANVVVQVWAQDNKFGKRINAQLLGVQFARDGERFAGGAVASADDFETIPEAGGGESSAAEIFG